MKRSRIWIMAAAAVACLTVLAGVGSAASQSTEDVSVLLLGAVKLTGSSLSLSAAQAQQLLPVVQEWRAQLEQSWGITRGASATTAAIEAILTPAQLERILAMRLTTWDAIRWGGGACELWAVRTLRPGVLPSEDGTTPGGGPWVPTALTLLPENPFLGFANRVARVLSGWATAG